MANIPGKRGGYPEHIGKILRRVFADLEKRYERRISGQPERLSGGVLTAPGPAPLVRRENHVEHQHG